MRPLALAFVLALALTGTAAAHLPANASKPKKLYWVEKAQERNLAHAVYHCRHAHLQENRRWHCAARRWIRRELEKTREKMRPAMGHTSMWLCIYSKERGSAGWATNTGNGYYGGLQMTWGWGGLPDGAGGGAHMYSADQQMAFAEAGYRASGYSTAWLFGQWPNTAPPCV